MEKDSHVSNPEMRRQASIEAFAQEVMTKTPGIDTPEALRRATIFYNLSAKELKIIYGDLDKLAEQYTDNQTEEPEQ